MKMRIVLLLLFFALPCLANDEVVFVGTESQDLVLSSGAIWTLNPGAVVPFAILDQVKNVPVIAVNLSGLRFPVSGINYIWKGRNERIVLAPRVLMTTGYSKATYSETSLTEYEFIEVFNGQAVPHDVLKRLVEGGAVKLNDQYFRREIDTGGGSCRLPLTGR